MPARGYPIIPGSEEGTDSWLTVRKGQRLYRALILNGYKLYKQTKAAEESRDKDSHIFNQGYSTNTNFHP